MLAISITAGRQGGATGDARPVFHLDHFNIPYKLQGQFPQILQRKKEQFYYFTLSLLIAGKYCLQSSRELGWITDFDL